MHTGKKIKLLRALKSITQEELSEKINKTRAMVSYIEQTGKVNHYTLLSILKVFGITEKEFEDFDGKQISSNTNSYEIKSELQQLQEKLVGYQKENKLLIELVETQKKIIKSLEDEKKKEDKENQYKISKSKNSKRK